jgi:hypothetical protein
LNRALVLIACLFALGAGEAAACSPVAPLVPRPGESDAAYRVRSWSDRLSWPAYAHIFSARVVAVISDPTEIPARTVFRVADVRVYRGDPPPGGELRVSGCGDQPPSDGRILVATTPGYTISGSNAWSDPREFEALEEALRRSSRRLPNPP